MCDLEGGVRRQRFGQVSACAIEHKVRQVSTYKATPVSQSNIQLNSTWTTLPLTSFVRLSTVPGLGKSRDLRHVERRSKRFVSGETAERTGDRDDDEDASGFGG